jgi:hypothetical protein
MKESFLTETMFHLGSKKEASMIMCLAFGAGAIELQEMIVYSEPGLTSNSPKQFDKIILSLELACSPTMQTEDGMMMPRRSAQIAVAAIRAMYATHEAQLG